MHDDLRQRRWIGRETFAQGRHIWQLVRSEITVEDQGEFGLTAAIMGERQEGDHDPARLFFGKLFEQPVKRSPIGVTREELVAVNKVEKRHRLTPQRVYHMA